MKYTKQFLGILAIGLLMLGPGLAHAQTGPADEAEGRLRGFEGEVVEGPTVLGEDGTLTMRDPRTGEERVILMTSSDGHPNFILKTPGISDISGVHSAVKPGAGVAVLARQIGGQWQAVEILVIPEEPTAAPRTGVVLESNPENGTITIITPSGITRILQLADGTQAPSEGDLVIAFAGPDRGGSGTAPSAGVERVIGLTRAADVRDRLESHLEAVTSDQSKLNAVDPVVKQNHIESLIDLLDHQSSRHFERLENALYHADNSNRRALIGALIQTGDARQQGRVQAQRVRTALAWDAGSADNSGEGNASDNSHSGSTDLGDKDKGHGKDEFGSGASGSIASGSGHSRSSDPGSSASGSGHSRSSDSGSSDSGSSAGSNSGGSSDGSSSGRSTDSGSSDSGSTDSKDKDKDKDKDKT